MWLTIEKLHTSGRLVKLTYHTLALYDDVMLKQKNDEFIVFKI